MKQSGVPFDWRWQVLNRFLNCDFVWLADWTDLLSFNSINKGAKFDFYEEWNGEWHSVCYCSQSSLDVSWTPLKSILSVLMGTIRGLTALCVEVWPCRLVLEAWIKRILRVSKKLNPYHKLLIDSGIMVRQLQGLNRGQTASQKHQHSEYFSVFRLRRTHNTFYVLHPISYSTSR